MKRPEAPSRTFPLLVAAAALLHFIPGQSIESGTVELAGERFRVEFATTEAERRRGLMHREELPPGTGMLFVYEHPQPVSFWNKDVAFPIDILYFDAGNALVRVDANVPPCPYHECPRYGTEAPVKYVLELPAGTAERLGVQEGDRLEGI